MNGAKKFHSPDGPAFNEGEVWVGSSNCPVTIWKTVRYGVDKWDVDVHYWVPMDARRSVECVKNAWSFQVRYQHKADLEI
ncbi:hypothetical protein phiPsa374_130 [Pseudomonas phage phiPsa374]|uniref:Uncharacterized protein n=4 Tax=Otagovirus TaxID=2560197 RepID=A0A7G9V2J0_9CAUD|nr:hypothetical protein CF96_gp090 [Pseudomonas phage phiPsa374]YP_010767055.1 hypothetical protein QGX15_gp097 [Pseudomonas phage psageK4e]YP_010767225.1 hypothetical protein QGX16_gp090 [Pseudomonas phage phiPsa397]YP_010767570.1 hypothetical protein QGX18_gp094 [Pseudomonas phage phiPsa347]AHJ87390.1 hypothetical protein phiPsa374_130 [Pseudomonas phage phiPsa374]QNO00496.1 hypothetical protein phiPsa347_134 [Pseudomonas phage phiPsa347]QNO00841.1 hypothetical protein phiPsa397_135 [Pseudo